MTGNINELPKKKVEIYLFGNEDEGKAQVDFLQEQTGKRAVHTNEITPAEISIAAKVLSKGTIGIVGIEDDVSSHNMNFIIEAGENGEKVARIIDGYSAKRFKESYGAESLDRYLNKHNSAVFELTFVDHEQNIKSLSDFNFELAEQRAGRISHYLEGQKIQASAIIGPNDSPIGEQALTDAEKERVVWASIMLEAGEDETPTTTDLQSMIDDFIVPITDWSQGADIEISGKYEEKQFNLYLHPATWKGNTAHLELSEQIHDDVELTQRNPEKFYFLKNKKAIKNNFYIFPLLISDIGSKEEPKREKLEESTFYWNDTDPGKRLAAATELGKCAITLESIGLSLPSFPEGFQWPVSTAANISGRFYDYRGGKTKFGINYIRHDKWDNDKVSGSSWTGDGLLKHTGTDLAIAAGTPVKAASKGIICFTEYVSKPGTGKLQYQGFSVVVSHGNGLYTHYAHLSKSKKFVLDGKTYSPAYPKGNSRWSPRSKISAMIGLKVDAGDTIGHVGDSTDHLHFEIRYRATEKEAVSSADTTGYDNSSPKELYYLSPEYYR